MSTIKRKSLPEIVKVLSINSAQSLHHFLTNSDWSVDKLKSGRLNKLKKALDGNAMTLVVAARKHKRSGLQTRKLLAQIKGLVRFW